jgi:hypothetical protein
MVVAIPPRNRSWEHVGDDENSDPARSRALLAQKGEITVTDKEPAGGPTGVDEIPVGIPLAWYPPDGPGRALVRASGSYRG